MCFPVLRSLNVRALIALAAIGCAILAAVNSFYVFQFVVKTGGLTHIRLPEEVSQSAFDYVFGYLIVLSVITALSWLYYALFPQIQSHQKKQYSYYRDRGFPVGELNPTVMHAMISCGIFLITLTVTILNLRRLFDLAGHQ
jgi:hypothetical protein